MAGPESAARRRGQSIWAVLAGFIAAALLAIITDEILHLAKVYPPWSVRFDSPALNALALGYRIVFTVFGGWLTARLAPQDPLRHAFILGLVGLPFGIAGVVVGISRDLGPAWYPIALVISGLPAAWFGGVLEARRRR